MRSYTDEGVVLTRRNYAEADRILSVYSRNHGRTSLIAKGVRKPESRKRGHIEVFNLIRFQSIKGKNLDLVTEAEIIDNFREVRKSLKRIALAYYFMEVVGRTTHEGEPNEELYELLIDYLNKLKEERELKKLRLDFILKLLITLGFWPKDKKLASPDSKLEEVVERQISSYRVGKILVE